MTLTPPLDLENGPVGAAEGCDLLLLPFSMPLQIKIKIKIKISQPSAAPTRRCLS
jgi:hypothetical protein